MLRSIEEFGCLFLKNDFHKWGGFCILAIAEAYPEQTNFVPISGYIVYSIMTSY